MNVSGGHLSKEFFELVKAIGESRSKQEEDRIILAEIITLKQRLSEAQVPTSKMREYLIRALYIEMLGHDSSFAYIHAVKMTQDKNLLCKRIGYLACSLCLDNEHELLLLLINTIQKDLSSSNHLEVAAALGCISKLVNEEMVPAIFPQVLNLMTNHTNELIRKKCCMVFHSLYKIQPQIVIAEARDATRRALCDPDPSVMGASLHLIHELAKNDKEAWKDLLPSLVSILKQITEHRLPRDYDYHRIPAPWIQIKLLSLFATLGEGDQHASEQMQEVLVEVLRRAELGANVGYAIIYECVKTITAIYPSSRLLDLAANSISRFISADNHNLKYVGITGLAAIVYVHPSFAAQPEHQVIVLDCLEDVDETLKRRTLELLFRMTNPLNAGAVVDKLLLHLRMSVDTDFRRDLVSKISRLADRFSPDHVWYVRTMNSVFELGGSLVADETAHNLLRLIAEGPTGNDDEDELFRRQIVDEYIKLAERASGLPDGVVKVASWVIGEYGSLNTVDGYSNLESLLALLCDCLERTYTDPTTRTWILSAVMKLSVLRLVAILSPNNDVAPDLFGDQLPLDDLINGTASSSVNGTELISGSSVIWPARSERLIPQVEEALTKFKHSESTDTELRARELETLILAPEPGSDVSTLHLLREIFPYDGACEDISVDTKLSFLDDYVSSCLASGARPYSKPAVHRTLTHHVEQINIPTTSSISSGLKFTPYAVPQKPSPEALRLTNRVNEIQPPAPVQQSNDVIAGSLFKVSGPRKWGPQGYQQGQKGPLQPSNPQELTQSSPTPKPIVVSSPPAPTGPRQLTEREISARALFSGLSSPTPLQSGTVQSRNDRMSSRWENMSNGMETKSSALSEDSIPSHIRSREPKNRRSLSHHSQDLLDLGPTSSQTNNTNGHVVDNLFVDVDQEFVDSILNPESPSQLSEPRRKTGPVDLITSLSSIQFSDKPTPHTQTPPSTANQSIASRLRPLPTTTAQVGSIWASLPAEKRTSISLQLSSINLVFKGLQKLLNLAIVELIGVEGIGAAQLVQQTEMFPIFVHAKLGVQRVDIILRGPDEKTLQEMVNLCESSLKLSC